ncbi:putative gustatory receptor 28b isoform X1 [Bradysia coprophila]|uniref:putative gustatory receptor 28b isoform X1 n=1 Tax=Bradysia coprophila TaxID=38358 RepID=UPI00187D83A7|nr:putative gustatory receptor 28b isoform X1 [Bradysia coprophila]
MPFFSKIFNRVKQVFNPTDVYASQRLLLRGSLIYGLIPYRLVVKDGVSSLQTSVLGFIAAILSMITFGISFMATILNQMNLMEFFLQSPISNFGGNLNLITSFLSITSVYVCSLVLRKKLKRMLETLSCIDGKFVELGIDISHRNALWFNLKSCFVATVACGIYTATTIAFLLQRKSGNQRSYSVVVTHFWPYFVLTNLILTFLSFTRLICTRFKAVNQILRNLCGSESTKSFNVTISPLKSFKQSQDSSSNLLAERKLVEVVKDVCGIHDDLSDTCLLAEEYFALKMLTIVGIGFLIIVFNLYYVMEIAFGQIPDEFQEESYKFLIFLVFQVAMNILGILCIIQSSCAISNENRNCSIYVHKLMNTTTDDIAKEKLLQFSLQLIHRKVKFTALNLFPLDRTLIFTIAGAATTYLIILFQFSNQNRFPNVKT